jgi:NIMA (never in mitosis gene a)-related kinase
MEYCDGSDLNTFIKKYKDKNEFIEEEILFNIILSICEGIKIIHDNNIIHRYLKPENILITENKTIKINNFQLARKINFVSCNSIGTTNYMAPEIINGEKYNNKIDIWSLGCIIYELLTLNVCFQGENIIDIIDKIINDMHGKIDTNKYNDKWQTLIDLLLKKNHKERPNINEVYKYLKTGMNAEKSKEINKIKNVTENKKIESINLKMKILTAEECMNYKKEGSNIISMKSKNNFIILLFIPLVLLLGNTNIGTTSLINT